MEDMEFRVFRVLCASVVNKAAQSKHEYKSQYKHHYHNNQRQPNVGGEVNNICSEKCNESFKLFFHTECFLILYKYIEKYFHARTINLLKLRYRFQNNHLLCNLMKKLNLYFLISLFPYFFSLSGGYAQVGGKAAYEFLNLVSSARVAALGGNLITVKDDDLSLFTQSPALLNSSMDKQLSLNYVNYFAGINYGFVAYSRSFDKYGSFAAGLQYINYGKFVRADETGEVQGEFRAGEYALHLGWAKQIDTLFSVGATLKTIYSSFDTYNSFGMALDMGATFQNLKRNFVASLVVKNAGVMIKPYTPGNHEPLPIEIQLGVSKRLEHLPFRLSIVAQHLETPDMSYIDPNTAPPAVDPLTGDSIKPKKMIGDKIMRHFIFGGEFLPAKFLSIRFGYNYQRRQELKVATKVSTIGISWGFGIKVSKFTFSYGRATYSLAGASNHISISTNLGEFYSKKTPPSAQ